MCEWQGIKLTSMEMAQLAYKLEREEIGLKGGKQDQYAAVFGGFNFMKFNKYGVNVNRVKIPEDTVNELQYSSLLCYTGNPRESATIIESQVDKFNKGQNEDALDKTKEIATSMVIALKHRPCGGASPRGLGVQEAVLQQGLQSADRPPTRSPIRRSTRSIRRPWTKAP